MKTLDHFASLVTTGLRVIARKPEGRTMQSDDGILYIFMMEKDEGENQIHCLCCAKTR